MGESVHESRLKSRHFLDILIKKLCNPVREAQHLEGVPRKIGYSIDCVLPVCSQMPMGIQHNGVTLRCFCCTWCIGSHDRSCDRDCDRKEKL